MLMLMLMYPNCLAEIVLQYFAGYVVISYVSCT